MGSIAFNQRWLRDHTHPVPYTESMSSRESQARREQARKQIQYLLESGGDWAGLDALLSEHPALEPELRTEFTVQKRVRDEQSIFGRMRREDKDFVSHVGSRAGDEVGDFRLVGRIGRGGQGEVWEAEQLSLRRRVALKLVLPDRINEMTLALLAREARAGGRLAHPGIVAVHGYGEDDGKSWIAQELVEGSWTLRDFIDEARDSEELHPGYYRSVAIFLVELAEALQAAHGAGVIHRDVKPQNVLVTPDDHPKLTDFGLARITDESAISMTGDFAGTWLYMSPEQVTASRIEVDHRTDIFSLGIVMYEMLALQRPFDGDTTHQIAENIVMRDPPDLRKIRSRVPRDLAIICGKALEKSRDARIQTMEELAADLRRYLTNVPILAKPPKWNERAAKWVVRNPTVSAVGAVLTIAITLVSGMGIQLANSNALLKDRTIEVQRNATRAQENAELAEKRAAEVLQLSASQVLSELLSDVEELWPVEPDRITAYVDWIDRAQTLIDELPSYRETREELESATTSASAARDERSGRLTDLTARWWSQQLTELIEGVEGLELSGLLEANEITAAYGWSIPKRLDAARLLQEGFVEGGGFAVRWERELPAIRQSCPIPLLEMQMGLVPIGPDPQSGLWEFWHVMSGSEPVRTDAGGLEVKPESGIVLVLLPGGKWWTRVPVLEQDIEPFFLSKYELTQAQWRRMTGATPSTSQGDFNPVETVTWAESTEVLSRAALSLPTSVQWQYGARCESKDWSGAPGESPRVPGYRNYITGFEVVATRFTAANELGLNGMDGNVSELCSDSYEVSTTIVSHGEFGKPSAILEVMSQHWALGGSFNYGYPEVTGRLLPQTNRRQDVGIRAARAIAKEMH
jgi:serine/threonine protein kinase/formylglycine-generating enzyme required for sulfatase activity